jgi:hypothetical protein
MLRSDQEFTAFFAELGVDFSDGWHLLFQDLKLARKDWPRVIAMAQKTSIRLVLERRLAARSSFSLLF